MLCDKCLLLIDNNLPDKTRQILHRLHNSEITVNHLAQETGQSAHEIRKRLLYLKGATLVWGDWSAYSISPAGERMIELLTKPTGSPAKNLCDTCLLQIGETLPPRESDILGVFSTRPLTRLQIVVATGLSDHKVREGLILLRGARLVEARSGGRAFYLTAEGRRLEHLWRQQLAGSREMMPVTA